MNTLLVYPEFPETFWSFKYAIKFINKKAANPPLGLVTIAAMLPKEWKKRLVDVNITSLTDDDIRWADIVMVSAMTVQRRSAHAIIKRCKSMGKKVVAGGPLFTGEYKEFPEADHFVLNEGELTLPEFLRDLENGTPAPCYSTDQFAEIQSTPVPMFELLEFNSYDAMSVQFTRGCPYACEFCNVTALLGHKPRLKTATQIIAELDRLYKLGWRRNIFFVDDNFIGNRRALKEEILPAIIEWRKNKKGCNFITEASINLADDRELIDLMINAGFISVFVGIETPSEEGLLECHKSQNVHRNLLESIHTLQRNGLQVMAGFIVGFDSDTPSIFQRQIDFIQQSGIATAMVGILQAPFGTPLYERMKNENRLLDEISGDNGDGSTNIIPKMDPQVLKDGYFRIVNTIFEPKHYYERITRFLRIYEPARSQVNIEFSEILALLRTIWSMGVFGRERWLYWRLFFQTLFTAPRKFPMAITLTVYGYHFRIINELNSQKVLSQKSNLVRDNRVLKTSREVIPAGK